MIYIDPRNKLTKKWYGTIGKEDGLIYFDDISIEYNPLIIPTETATIKQRKTTNAISATVNMIRAK